MIICIIVLYVAMLLEMQKSILLIKFKEGGVCGQNVLWCSAYGGQICITLQWWITTWGDTKEREYMIRKKRIDEYIFKIKPNLLKKSI